MAAEVYSINGIKRDIETPKASGAIKSMLSDLNEMNNTGRVKCMLVTMVLDNGKAEHCFSTTGIEPLTIVGALESAKSFYLNLDGR